MGNLFNPNFGNLGSYSNGVNSNTINSNTTNNMNNAPLNNTNCSNSNGIFGNMTALQTNMMNNFNRGVFSLIDSDGNGHITQNEYEDYYVGGKEASTGTIFREGNPDLIKYRKEAKNLFDAVAQQNNCIGKTIYDKDGKAVGMEPVNAITLGRYNATSRVLNKFGKSAEQRMDIIKQEGPKADIFNGKNLGELVDQEQTKELNQGNSYNNNSLGLGNLFTNNIIDA